MSYSVNTNCWNCALLNNPCKDAEKLQAGVNTMYNQDGTHSGSGQILMSCSNHMKKDDKK